MSFKPQLGENEIDLDDLLADCEELFPTSTRSNAAASSTVSKTWSSAMHDSLPNHRVTKETKTSWHQRRKEEILSLRKLVTQLSTELEQCKTVAGISLASAKANQASMAQKWQKLAEVEFMRRQNSDKENAKLRKEVYLCILQAKALRRSASRKLHKTTTISSSSTTSQLVQRGVNSPSYNSSIFNELIADMDEVYAGLNGFFARIKMHDLPCPGQRNDAVKNRSSGPFVNLLECYAVPFDLRATEKAVWAITTTPAGDLENVEAQYYEADSNTRMKTASVCIVVDGLELRLVVHVAARKYVEQDRTVIVLRLIIEPIPEVFNVAFREISRIVLKHGEPSLIGPTTVMQRSCRITDHEGLSSCRNAHSGWKTSTYYLTSAKSWETSVSQFNHRVEDMLLRK